MFGQFLVISFPIRQCVDSIAVEGGSAKGKQEVPRGPPGTRSRAAAPPHARFVAEDADAKEKPLALYALIFKIDEYLFILYDLSCDCLGAVYVQIE